MCNKSQGFYGLNSTLSPAAQAVDIAIYGLGLHANRRQIAAAAFRAVSQHMHRGKARIDAIVAELDGGTTSQED